MMTSFDNNEDKVCLLLKDDVGGLHVRSHTRSYDLGSCDYGDTPLLLLTFGHLSDIYFHNHLT